MGKIIAFPSGDGRMPRPETSRRAGSEAEILFFLGVRYQRVDDPPIPESTAPLASGGAAARHRKRKRRA